MIPQKNQDSQKPAFLDGLQSEVSAESAPLLQFITRYAGFIAGAVVLLLLIVGAMAIWQWQHNAKQREAREELARVSLELSGSAKAEALARLAKDAPDSVQLYAWLSAAQSAMANGDAALAQEAYATAAQLDERGALGLAAALGSAQTLLEQGEYARAAAILGEIETKYPQAAQSPQLKQLLAEAAVRANDLPLAIRTYEWLAAESPDTAYYKTRIAALRQSLPPQK